MGFEFLLFDGKPTRDKEKEEPYRICKKCDCGSCGYDECECDIGECGWCGCIDNSIVDDTVKKKIEKEMLGKYGYEYDYDELNNILLYEILKELKKIRGDKDE